jgi:hypothetical protein
MFVTAPKKSDKRTYTLRGMYRSMLGSKAREHVARRKQEAEKNEEQKRERAQKKKAVK